MIQYASFRRYEFLNLKFDRCHRLDAPPKSAHQMHGPFQSRQAELFAKA